MTAFPSLIPSTRTFTPGIYPHTAFVGMSGRSNRVRNSNVMLESQLRLTFMAITESQMLSILAHYNGRQGSFQSFPLPSEIWSGGVSSDYQLAGYGWIYKEPPTVEDLMCGGHNVELLLETVPPEGTALLGLSLTLRYLLAAGTAATADGAALSMSYSLAAGEYEASGMNGTIAYSLAPGAAEGVDPDFASVSLLLHMDGSNGSTTFTDSSAAARTVTANGNAQISTAQSKFGGASGLFDGSADYITFAPATDLQFNADFTIECWVRTASTSDMILASSSSDSNTQVFRLNEGASGRLSFFLNGTQVFSATAAGITINTWHHLAITRSGGSTRMFVDGEQKGSTNTSWSGTFRMDVIGTFFFVGSRFGNDYNGYIDDLRITKGVARYTANFTPPTDPFPDS